MDIKEPHGCVTWNPAAAGGFVIRRLLHAEPPRWTSVESPCLASSTMDARLAQLIDDYLSTGSTAVRLPAGHHRARGSPCSDVTAMEYPEEAAEANLPSKRIFPIETLRFESVFLA